MKSTVAHALAGALEHHRRGRLAEAEAGYREVLERVPDQPDALHRLGVIAHRTGRNEIALSLIDRAIAARPHEPTCYNDAGIVLHALGRRDDAADRFRSAVSLKPDYVAAQNNLANVLREQGSAAEAAQVYRKALQSAPSSPELWYNLGNALTDLRAFEDAAAAYGNAASLRPDFADARGRLGDALLALGKPDDAAAHYARALILNEAPETIAGFVRSLVTARLHGASADVRQMAIRALATPWSRPSELAAACIRLIADGNALRGCIDRAWRAWPSRLTLHELFGADADAVFGDLLLRTLLESAPVCDLQMERLLTHARCALLFALHGNDELAGAQALGFCCALARQCYINDYVFGQTEPEIGQASALRDRLVASLRRGETPVAPDIAVAAAYFPLLALAHAESLLERAWPQPLAALLEQQLREPLEERRLRELIARVTTVDDEVSVRVRRQYEEHPYPRWIRLPPSGPAASVAANPGTRFPLEVRRAGEQGGRLDVLVAGCGTGQESIELAQALPRARVLAIDLSLASLAYAQRKVRELRVANVEHAQADLMQLRSLGRQFDVISSVGVLHHLADPMRGWRELVSILAPGGHMLVGLYSERGRGDVVAARAFIAERGYVSTEADIRRCRQDLVSADGGARFSRLAMRNDFYVTAECRDLLFHVQEHRFTLPGIRECVGALGLRFNGFLLPPDVAARYAQRYPGDPGMEDLGNWDAFEAQFPETFAGMYIFWVRKTP